MQNKIQNIASFWIRRIKWFWLRRQLQRQISKDEWGFVCPYGIGDTYLLLSLLGEFQKKFPKDKIKLFVKPSHQEIPAMFGYKNIIPVDSLITAHFEENSKLVRGKVVVAHPFGFGMTEDLENIGKDDRVFSDNFKKFLGLPSNTSFDKPKLAPGFQDRAKIILKKSGYVPGKTVILAPDAASISTFSMNFWKKLEGKLTDAGFKVLYNGNVVIDGAPVSNAIDFSLGEAIPISELSGHVVSIRSGLCDLLSTAKCNLIVLYPDAKWYSGSVFDGSSLVKMGLSDSAHEIIYQDKDKDMIIEQVLGIVRSH